jgi:hypothetical protein
MPDTQPLLTPRAKGHGISLREAMNLQAIEGNPLTAEQVEMFEMFDREGWTDEQRRGHIVARARRLAAG